MKKAKPLSAAVDDFAAHLKAKGLAASSVNIYRLEVKKFLAFVGNQPIERINQEQVRSFFDGMKNPNTKRQRAQVISQFLTFAATKLPAVVNAMGADVAPLAPHSEKEVALRASWAIDKLIEQKERGEDLIAKLARRVIDHFVYFQERLKGEPENIDDVVRFADECSELIKTNLTVFMSLSASGKNVHSKIDEKVQK